MRALTLWQPWAACIAHGPKRVENRKRPPPKRWGMPFEMAVHSAKKVCSASELARWPSFELWPGLSDAPQHRGCVVAVADVVGFYRLGTKGRDLFRSVPPPDPWAAGPWCWELDNVHALAEPVPCRGQQGPWALPQGIEAEVRRQLEEQYA